MENAELRIEKAGRRGPFSLLTSHFSLRGSPLVLCGLLGLCAAGCSHVNRAEQVDRAEQLGIDEFLHEHLPRQPMVTAGEAYRALLLLADGEEKCASFQERAAELERRHWVRREWNLSREQPIDSGAVAYIVLAIIHGQRGVNSLMLGSLGLGERRYALRDLVYLGLIDDKPAYRWMTGGELLDLMGKADDYMARHKLYPAEPVNLRQELSSRPAEG